MTYEEILDTLIAHPNSSPHYCKRYVNFIKSCKVKNTSLGDETYTENHHILPKANNYWPEYRLKSKYPWNTVVLTAGQHFLAHWILAKALGGSMWFAFNMMFVFSTNGDRIKYSSRKDRMLYAELRRECKENLSRINKGRKPCPEMMRKLHESNRNRVYSDESRKQMSVSSKKALRKKYYWKTYINMYQGIHKIRVGKHHEEIIFQRLAEGWTLKASKEFFTNQAVRINSKSLEDCSTNEVKVYYGQFYCTVNRASLDYSYLMGLGGSEAISDEYRQRLNREMSERSTGKTSWRKGRTGETYLVWDEAGNRRLVPVGEDKPEDCTRNPPQGKKKYYYLDVENRILHHCTPYLAEINGWSQVKNPNKGRKKFKMECGQNIYLNINTWEYDWIPKNITPFS